GGACCNFITKYFTYFDAHNAHPLLGARRLTSTTGLLLVCIAFRPCTFPGATTSAPFLNIVIGCYLPFSSTNGSEASNVAASACTFLSSFLTLCPSSKGLQIDAPLTAFCKA
ncbi:unnamed protein product, partial [Chrysoparadoxa australica]